MAALCGGIMESCCLQKVQTQLKNYISELSKYEAWNLVMLGALIKIDTEKRDTKCDICGKIYLYKHMA